MVLGMATKIKPPQIQELLRLLHASYGDAVCALDHKNPFELLAATILSAQCTDKRVNMVTPTLFARFPTPEALAQASPAEVEEIVKSTGFFRNKAKSLIGMAQALVRDHGGEVPRSMEALVALPGVARKTANVVMGVAFKIASGVVVDTHVGRLSRRLGLTQAEDPVKVEQALTALLPRSAWIGFSHMLIHHGRAVCAARKPACERCTLVGLCPSASSFLPGVAGAPKAKKKAAVRRPPS